MADDKLLIARSRDGDTEAFRELFERKHRRVYLIAYQILGDPAQSEDVAQEVFLRLWERCADYDDSFPVDAWLRRIATNRAIDHWRVRRNERSRRVEPSPAADGEALLEHAASATPSMPGEDPAASLEWRQLQAIWDDLAADLPPQQRAAFVLRYIEGMEPGEVAEALGCTLSTVRSHVFAARKSLRAALRRSYPEFGGSV